MSALSTASALFLVCSAMAFSSDNVLCLCSTESVAGFGVSTATGSETTGLDSIDSDIRGSEVITSGVTVSVSGLTTSASGSASGLIVPVLIASGSDLAGSALSTTGTAVTGCTFCTWLTRKLNAAKVITSASLSTLGSWGTSFSSLTKVPLEEPRSCTDS